MTLYTLGNILFGIGSACSWGLVFCWIKRDRYVRGTHQRYVYNAVATLLVYGDVFGPLGTLLKGEILSTIILGVLFITVYIIWMHDRDDDDFWTNFRKKIGAKLRSMTTSASLTPVHVNN